MGSLDSANLEPQPLAADDIVRKMTRQHVLTLQAISRPGGVYRWKGLELVDFDLIAWGLARWLEDKAGGTLAITTLGVDCLAQVRKANQTRRKPHDDMAHRLAQKLSEDGKFCWVGIEFLMQGKDCMKAAKALDVTLPDFRPEDYCAACRPDVFTLDPTYIPSKSAPCVYEVKVSRADFLADVRNPLKRLHYALLAQKVFYVTPDGLVTKEDVPEMCGLLYEMPDGSFQVIKRAKKIAAQPPLNMRDMLQLALKQPTYRPNARY